MSSGYRSGCGGKSWRVMIRVMSLIILSSLLMSCASSARVTESSVRDKELSRLGRVLCVLRLRVSGCVDYIEGEALGRR